MFKGFRVLGLYGLRFKALEVSVFRALEGFKGFGLRA